MNTKKVNDILSKMVEEESFYGRTLRYFLAIYYKAVKPYYDRIDKIKAEENREVKKSDFTEDEIFDIEVIKFVHEELVFGLVDAYYKKRSLEELRRWASNYAWKTTIYSDIPPYLEKVGKEWNRDFEDIVDGTCDGLFTDEMKKLLVLKVGNVLDA